MDNGVHGFIDNMLRFFSRRHTSKRVPDEYKPLTPVNPSFGKFETGTQCYEGRRVGGYFFDIKSQCTILKNKNCVMCSKLWSCKAKSAKGRIAGRVQPPIKSVKFVNKHRLWIQSKRIELNVAAAATKMSNLWFPPSELMYVGILILCLARMTGDKRATAHVSGCVCECLHSLPSMIMPGSLVFCR